MSESIIQQTEIQRNRKLLSSIKHETGDFDEYIENLNIVLKVFGFDSFRDNQMDPIMYLFTKQDLLFITSTGGGKTLTFVAPSLAMGYQTIVFSPLISLIQDQSVKLAEKGIRVGVINSTVTQPEKIRALSRWENRELDFLFVAPERLNSEDFLSSMKKVNPDMVVVDEIHCASEYGDSFRPSYCLIPKFISEFKPKQFLGLTATLSDDVYYDLNRIFGLENTKKIVKSYRRNNLHYRTWIYEVGETTPNSINHRLFMELNKQPLVPTIVYCSTVKMVDELFETYGKSIIGGAAKYNGDPKSVSQNEREANQQAFLSGKVRVVFATNSFGMGVDKPDIGRVVFRSIPSSIEELIQGFGRGGRNGCDCDCLFIADMKTMDTQNWFLDQKYPPETTIRQFFRGCESLANEDKIIENTLSDICRASGVDLIYSGSISNILQKYKVVQRTEKPKIAKIRFLSRPDDGKSIKKFPMYEEKINLLGVENTKEQCLEVDLSYLAEQIGVSETTVKKQLTSFSDAGYIYFKAPLNRAPLKITGKISDVDFIYLNNKACEKDVKLEEIKKFIYLEDSKKPDYIQEYFDSK